MKHFFTAFLLLILVACASTPEPMKKAPTEPVSDSAAFEAIQLYNLAEFDYQQKNLEAALDKLMQAKQYDPPSVSIRNRIAEILLELALEDESFTKLAIETTENDYQQGFRSVAILSTLADAYFLNGQSEKGIGIFEELIEIDASAINLYKYYLLKLQYFNEEDPDLLEEALEKSWDNERMVLILANQLKAIRPERADKTFARAWEKFQDEDALVELISYYRETGKSDELLELLTQLMHEKRDITGWMREALLKNLFLMEHHQEIIDNRDWFLDSDIDLTDTYIILYWSADKTDNDSLMIDMLDNMLTSRTLTQRNRDRYLTLTGFKLARQSEIETAAQYLTQVEEPSLLNRELEDFHSDSTLVTLNRLVDTMQQIAPNDSLNAFLHAMVELKARNTDAAISWLDNVDVDYILRNGLSFQAMEVYVAVDDTLRAMQAIKRDSTVHFYPRLLIGVEYAENRNYPRTIKYLQPLIDEKPNTSPQAYTALAIAYCETNQLQRAIELMQSGIAIFPKNMYLKNDLAFILADNNTELEQAQQYMQEVLENRSDLGGYWDTAAWVEFRLDNMDKALEYIEKALDMEPENTAFSYHAGEIYHKIGNHEKAKQSLRNAVLFDNNDNDAEKARKALEEFYQITLEEQ